MKKKMKSFQITVHGGEKPDPERKGKLTWPASFHISMDKYFAWEMVGELIAQLKRGHPGNGNEKFYTISYCGSVEEIKGN